ncbi:MAG: hypothetical protein H6741_31690 [Alphaproteobacteria bacterium]|nr:hypothetical protein [Alphaproteobacteria bacterium]MCB9797275.1 hypothetical protein [Alphaproteobacteria bacterium]
MSLLLALLIAPLAWAQDSEALSRREAKAAFAASQAALYHLPTQGTLSWTLRTSLPGVVGGEMPPCLSVSFDLSTREWESRVICQDAPAAMLAQEREALILDEVIKLMLVWHGAPGELERGDRAWRRGQEVVFAFPEPSSGEFMHTDAVTGLPIYSQDARGLNVEFGFRDTPDGAVMELAQTRLRDGALEIGMEMQHRLAAPGVWWLSHATLTQGGAYLGELWFEELHYAP